ncbi:MAG: NAD(P)-dependent oxidoreductase [Synergistaceae bacterium]|nr:NAD(P)-dependent oxidoreductase [Synergistaceae bacterium]
MKRIAFFGLGRMGLPMARRLQLAGHSLRVVLHSNPAPVQELQALGAHMAKSPADAVSEAEIIISILPGDRDIEALLLSPGIKKAVKPGAVLIEMSTATSGCVQRLAEVYGQKGVSVLDAPVSGGVKGAAEGTLTIIAGGDSSALEAVRPVLDVLASKIFHVGVAGAGKAMKAVNQMIVGANAVIVSEALRVARHHGMDLEKVYEVISSSTGASPIFLSKFEKMASEDFTPGFTLALMKKDMKIALAEGEGCPLPVASLAYALYLMIGEEGEKQDFSVVSTLFQGNKGSPQK